MIWRQKIDLEKLNNIDEYMGTFLGIEFTNWTEDSLTATMPVEVKTKQPYGVLHGGASVVLAETIGSIASNLIIDNNKYAAVGLEINANHIRSVKSGFVKGVAKPIHTGRKTHVWDIKIYNELEKIVCASRLTVAIVDK
jgi:1,4-dihydroxy-2-naphthoyl-CoA hydrolase